MDVFKRDGRKPGFSGMDRVTHCGNAAKGRFCRTLTATDVYSGWTEERALPLVPRSVIPMAASPLHLNRVFSPFQPLLTLSRARFARFVRFFENRVDGEKLTVNYLYSGIYNREKGKITYRNSWIIGKTITKENVKLLTECGRARWKIENENNNNILKNCGYHLEHNSHPGKNRAGEKCNTNRFGCFAIYSFEPFPKPREIAETGRERV